MKTLLLTVVMLSSSSVFGQAKSFAITGSVADSSTGERLPYASVVIVGTSSGSVADINGYFILRGLPPKNLKLRVSAVGYVSKEFSVHFTGKHIISVDFRLRPRPSTMPNVEVVGKTLQGVTGVAGNTLITAGNLRNSVAIFRNDVVQYVTQLPGVVTVSGISSQYYVRGGGPDENLVLVDGMQIYNLSHAFGLFSFVDPLIVRVANFSAGGFQAEYGGRLSSVFDIRTIDGDKHQFKTQGSLDLLSSDILVTGPLSPGGNTSFVAFFRRPLFQNALQKFYSLSMPFDYYDGFAKASVDLSGTGHISAEFLTSSDKITQQSLYEPDFKWSNNSGAVSGAYILGDRFDMQFSVSTSHYHAEQLPKESTYLGYQLDDIQNSSLHCNVTAYTSSRDQIDVGLLFSFPDYSYTFTNRYGSILQETVSEIEPQAWVEYDFNPHGRLAFALGLRTDFQRAFQALSNAPGGYLAEPRLTLSYRLSDALTVYADYGIYHQRLMDLNDENLVFTPFDVIAPLPDSSQDEESSQYILGCKWNPTNLISSKVEAYYKDLNHLATVNLQKVYSWESDYLFGTGKAYGVDVSFKYDAGRSLYFQAGYSYGMTTRTFDGVTYYPRYDLRNQLNLSTGFQPVNKLWVRGRLKLTSGLPYTPIDGYFGVVQFNPTNLPAYTGQALYSQALFGKLNSARLPGYQSLDLSASYKLDLAGTSFNLQATVINVLDKKNVFYINNVTGNVVYQLPTVFNLSLGWDI